MKGSRVVSCVLGLIALATPTFGDPWQKESEIAPSTLEARTSEAALKLVFKTPVERLKNQSIEIEQTTGPVRLTVTKVKDGTGENELWEFRFDLSFAYGPGTWVVFRDGLGRFREVRLILEEESTAGEARIAHKGTWLRFSPISAQRKTRFDVFVAGRIVLGALELPVAFDELPTASEVEIAERTAAFVPWSAVLPERRWEDERSQTYAAQLRKALVGVPAFPEGLWLVDSKANDVGTDASGNPWGAWAVLPSSHVEPRRGLGPWGVSLYATQGLLSGWKLPYVGLRELLRERSELPGYSKALSEFPPSFNLDWIRNLGLNLRQGLLPQRPSTDVSADVRDVPLLTYVENAGYAVEEFAPLMQLLASTRPGSIYLATLNSQAVLNRSASDVLYSEPVVLVPWIGIDRKVRVAVFRGVEDVALSQWLAPQFAASGGRRPDHVLLVELPLPRSPRLLTLPLR